MAAQTVVPPDYMKWQRWSVEKLPAGEVARLEQAVAQNPHDIESRTRLMFAYMVEPNNQQRAKHVHWMIENHPEAELWEWRGTMLLFPEPGPLGDNASYTRGAELWQRQATIRAGEPAVVLNAARFLSGYYQFFSKNPSTAEEWIRRGRAADPRDARWPEQLAFLYVRGLGDSEKDGSDAETRRFADHVRAELEKSNEGLLLGKVGRNLTASGLFSPALQEYGRKLEARASALGYQLPDPALNRMPTPGAPRELDAGPQPVKRVEPVYPPAAIQGRIEGVVRLRVLISKTGAVQQVDAVTGHSILVKAAEEAVRKWTYAPQSLPALVEIELPFRLPR